MSAGEVVVHLAGCQEVGGRGEVGFGARRGNEPSSLRLGARPAANAAA